MSASRPRPELYGSSGRARHRRRVAASSEGWWRPTRCDSTMTDEDWSLYYEIAGVRGLDAGSPLRHNGVRMLPRNVVFH